MNKPEKIAYLFVYGTLLHDANHPQSNILKRYGKAKGKAVFRGKLYDVGSYPAAIASKDETDEVFGEVYKLTRPEFVFEKLDIYEGYFPGKIEKSDYIRKKVTISCFEEETTLKAWTYLYNKSVDKLPPISNGKYLDYLRSKYPLAIILSLLDGL
ncbi:MAG TPA: gamma-glutamylcyclotransferase family protein [Balneolaceae bacterium]|nr:gamma-glutamylcyclotransferase family protein [Balneolaceae bacterium]